MARSRRKAPRRPATRSQRTAPARVRGAPTRRVAAPRISEPVFALGFAALCVLLALAFFREFVFRGGTMPFGTDMLEEAYPLRNFAVEELRAGRPFPAWNPFTYSGIPFLETLPYPVFYPTSLLYFVIPLGRAIGWGFVLHFFAAGCLMFVFARRLGVSRWGAALAGLAFMLNGYLVSHLYAGQDGRMFAMTLIPLVFYFLRVGLDTGRLAPYLLMGGAVALQIFTPHVQIMYFSSLAALAYFLTEAVARWRRNGPRPALAQAACFATGFALAALVAAVQLWPTAAFLEWAVRGVESGYAFASSWAMPPAELSALIAPDLFGSLATYWGANPFKLHTEYAGAVPLVLALAALLWGERHRTLFWALLALAALLFALGSATPVHRLAYEIVPMIRSFRAPSMMIAVAAFALAVLAGLGFDAVAGGGERRERAAEGKGRVEGKARPPRERGRGRWDVPSLVFISAAGLLALAWLLAATGALEGLVGGAPASAAASTKAAARSSALRAFPASFGITVSIWLAAAALLWWGLGRAKVSPSVAAPLLAALLVIDLWRVDARYLEVINTDSTFEPGPAEEFLAGREPPFRILSFPGAMGTNESILHRLEAVWGLQKFRLAWYDELLGGSAAANLRQPALWRVLNLRYLVVPGALDMPGLERVFDGEPTVYEWRGAAPRAWLAAEGRVVEDDEALKLLLDPAFEVRRVALLGDALALPPPDIARPSVSGGTSAATRKDQGVRYLAYTPDRLEAEVTAGAPSYAVFSEAYHPYWQARVDGRPAKIARADLAFRAVAVPAGTHRVTMEYRPRAFERARIVSLLALAVALGYASALGWGAWRRGSLLRRTRR